MTECHIKGCLNLQTICTDCGRLVCEKVFSSMQWISVQDKLPELYDFVLVFAHNKGTNEPKPISIARIINKQNTWDMLGNLEEGAYQDIEYSMDTTDITHWMPLPEEPNE